MNSRDQDDRVDPTVLDAWAIEPLADDFAERVVAEAFELDEHDSARSSEASAGPGRRRGWAIAGLAALVASLALVLVARPELRNQTAPPASEPNWSVLSAASLETVDIGGRARVELRSGARLAWRVSDDGETELRQDFGRVRYEVEPGGPFVINTPAGHVRVVGTTFTVEVMKMKQAHKRWVGLTATAGIGLATWVFVHHGEVEVANAEGTLAVHADRQVLMTESAPPQALPSRPAVESDTRTQRRRTRDEAARRIRRRLAEHPRERPDAERNPDRADEVEAAERPYLRPEQLAAFEHDYIRDVMADQLVPSARTCYNEILLEDPDYAGTIVLNFTIISDEDIGGVVDEVNFGEETDIDNPRFLECMQSATYETLFPPPEEGGEIKLSYPLKFEPG